jgi:hypothetical protein
MSLVLVAAAFSGCGSAHQGTMDPSNEATLKEVQAAKQKFDQALADCQRRYPDPHQKPVTPRARCFANAIQSYASAKVRLGGNEQMDLVRLDIAKGIEISERYDAGRITAEQFDRELAESDANLNSRLAQRRNEAAIATAAQQQANTALLQQQIAAEAYRQKAISQAVESWQRAYRPTPITTTHTTCSPAGNGVNVNCTSSTQ